MRLGRCVWLDTEYLSFFDTLSRIIFHFRCDTDTLRVSMCSYQQEVKYYITSGNKSKAREIGNNELYLYCEILL